MLPGDRPQPALWTILTPKWRGALARLRQERQGSLAKPLLAIIVGSGFWAAVFGVAYRVLSYIQKVAEIGDLLAGKMLATILLAFLSILLLSNMITALSTFFLAKDLDLLVAAPVGWDAALPRQAGRDDGPLVVDGGAAGAADPHRVRHRLLAAGRCFPSWRWRRSCRSSSPGGDRHRSSRCSW